MGFFASSSASDKPGESTSLTGKGPKDLEERKCTDCICLVFFAVFWAGMVGLMGFVYSAGDVNKIVHGTDYMGNTCGVGNFTQRNKVWYPRIGDDVMEQSSTLASGFWWDINLYGVCVQHCPTYHANRVDVIQDYGYGHSAEAARRSWPVYMDTLDLFNRCLQETQSESVSIELCTVPNCTSVGAPCYSLGAGIDVPAGSWALDGSTPSSMCGRELVFSYGATVRQPGANSYLNWLFESVGALKDTYESVATNLTTILLFGVVLSLVINFCWLILLYLFAKVAVWACIIAVLLGELLGAIFCFIKAGGVSAATSAIAAHNLTSLINTSAVGDAVSLGGVSTAATEDQWLWGVAGAVTGVCFLLSLIFVCCSCKAIGRCIVLVEQGSVALGSSMGLAIFPIFIATFQFAVLAVLSLTLMTLTTVGGDTPYHARLNATSATVQDGVIGGYLVFGGLWTYAFLNALTLMTVAGCIFYFYFVNKATVPSGAYMPQYDDNQTRFPVLTHLGWVLRYHLGTLAFGSLIVAVIMMVQLLTKALFTYLEKNAPGGNSAVIKLVSSCVQCCLWCFKKTVEFINSYSYIYCFVENVGFCSGCMKTFSLMLRYPAQIAINASVQMVLATLLTVTTPLVCSTGAFMYFDFLASDAATHGSMGGLMLPGAVLVLSLLMSRAFASVWEQVIQSLTVCVLLDIDNFDGRFLRPSMKDAFGDPKKAPPAEEADPKKEGLIAK